MKKNKKINRMSIEELTQAKEKLEVQENHERFTKPKKAKPTKVVWQSDQTQGRYYKQIIREIREQEKRKKEND